MLETSMLDEKLLNHQRNEEQKRNDMAEVGRSFEYELKWTGRIESENTRPT